MTESIGPLLNVASFCEKILEDKDGTISLVRLVDRVQFGLLPAVFDEQGSPLSPSVELGFFVRFSSSNLAGTHQVSLAFQNTENEEKELATNPIVFVPERNGANLRVNMLIGVKRQGFCWMKVYLDGTLLTRVPLEFVENPPPASDSKTPPSV